MKPKRKTRCETALKRAVFSIDKLCRVCYTYIAVLK